MCAAKAKACDSKQGWVELVDTDPMIPTLTTAAQAQGKNITAATPGCVYRQTIVQKMCNTLATPTVYQYGGKVQMLCPDKKQKPGNGNGNGNKPGKLKNVMVDFIGGYPVVL
jgi:hypothetical protein